MNGLERVLLMQLQDGTRYWDRPGVDGWARVLATFPLFSGVSKRRLRKLVRDATLAEFAPGERVVSTGESADCLYIVLSGAASAVPKPATRALRTGDYFGELGLIDEAPRSATIVATQELHVMKLPRQAVIRLARQHPAVTLSMLKNISTQLRRLETHVARSV